MQHDGLVRQGRRVVYAMGATGLDCILEVAKYPERDEKIRASSYISRGGGNAANTATAISRLCPGQVIVRILSKIGGIDDPAAIQIMSELRRDAVDTEYLFSSSNRLCSSPQTYIINDMETNSRTCIHVPMEEELTPEDIGTIEKDILETAHFIHLDSRHTNAAIHLANKALEAGVPLSLDIEKYRPGAADLLKLCDIIFTNEKFPGLFESQTVQELCADREVQGVAEAMDVSPRVIAGMMGILANGRTHVVVTTMGSHGALLLRREGDEDWDRLKNCIRLPFTFDEMDNAIYPGMFDAISYPLSRKDFEISPTKSVFARSSAPFSLFKCPVWPHQSRPIVDSTGAGDSFIGKQ